MENRDIRANVAGWVAPVRPGDLLLEGRFARVVRLSSLQHARALFDANGSDQAMWDYMAYGPYADLPAYREWVESVENGLDPIFFAIFDKTQSKWLGVASYLRIDPLMGSIEVGNIAFSQDLQRTRAATESMYLMMKWAFESGYRRYEWKCNAANAPSRSAAQRFGFSFEGVFRQHLIVKNRNRDTAWFAIIDSEWSAMEQAFENWLSQANFDERSVQKLSLRHWSDTVLVQRDPTLR